jgi:hypothetical protein
VNVNEIIDAFLTPLIAAGYLAAGTYSVTNLDGFLLFVGCFMLGIGIGLSFEFFEILGFSDVYQR